MSKAKVGHSAFDPTMGIVGQLSSQDAEAQVTFLKAAVEHAQGQAEQAEKQYEAIAEKWQALSDAWTAKLDEADHIRNRAHETVDAYTRELEALVG